MKDEIANLHTRFNIQREAELDNENLKAHMMRRGYYNLAEYIIDHQESLPIEIEEVENKVLCETDVRITINLISSAKLKYYQEIEMELAAIRTKEYLRATSGGL